MARDLIKLKALDFAKKLTDGDFDTAFCQVVGYVSGTADGNPDAVYAVEEVAELFDLLFGMRNT